MINNLLICFYLFGKFLNIPLKKQKYKSKYIKVIILLQTLSFKFLLIKVNPNPEIEATIPGVFINLDAVY